MSYPTRFFLLLGCLLLPVVAVLWALELISWLGPAVLGMLASFALYLQGNASLKTFVFTVWVLASVAAGMFYPDAFLSWGTSSSKGSWSL